MMNMENVPSMERQGIGETARSSSSPCTKPVGRTKSDVIFNLHLLRCAQKQKQALAIDQLEQGLKAKYLRCDWAGCGNTFTACSILQVAKHFTRYLQRSTRRCKFPICSNKFGSRDALEKHLLAAHQTPTEDVLPRWRFCFECQIHISTNLEWKEHCRAHLLSFRMFCGRTQIDGILLTASLCPFCLGDTELSAHARYAQFTKTDQFNVHVANHLCLVESWPFVCPHPICDAKIEYPHAYWEHGTRVHGLTAPRANGKAFQQTVAMSQPGDSCTDEVDTLEMPVLDEPCRDEVSSTLVSGPHQHGEGWFSDAQEPDDSPESLFANFMLNHYPSGGDLFTWRYGRSPGMQDNCGFPELVCSPAIPYRASSNVAWSPGIQGMFTCSMSSPSGWDLASSRDIWSPKVQQETLAGAMGDLHNVYNEAAIWEDFTFLEE